MCAAVSSSIHCGIDVCVDEDVLMKAPHCPHGPTLLFERFTPGKLEPQRYYACSACRDRKDCGFFQLYSDTEIISETKQQMREEYNRSRQPWQCQEEFYKRFTQTEALSMDERTFCYDCQLLIQPSEHPAHKRHRLKKGISRAELGEPSYLIDAIENNKTNAQYLFSMKAVKFLAQTIKSLGFTRVLCVGVPRLHEFILSEASAGLDSLLLDIDHRFGQFYPPSQFCRYNMFNHFFLDGPQSQDICRDFLARDGGEGVVMVTDPPFGGMVDALAAGVRWKMNRWGENVTASNRSLPVMWIFPYFLEHRILDGLKGFKMLDYKVDYDNHPLFKSGSDAKKKGSPVRIFTNLDPAKIELPQSEGYRFCKVCQRFVAAENLHCPKCNECPSKNGTTYRHCDPCNKCVKPSFTHCKSCNLCELPTHDCNRTLSGCHVCGALDHKRRDCPRRTLTQKRPHYQTNIGTDKLRTWPKRKKKKRATLSIPHQFGPVEEPDVSTPQAVSSASTPEEAQRLSFPASVDSPGDGSSCSVDASSLGSPLTALKESSSLGVMSQGDYGDSPVNEVPTGESPDKRADDDGTPQSGRRDGGMKRSRCSVDQRPHVLEKSQSLKSLGSIGTEDGQRVGKRRRNGEADQQEKPKNLSKKMKLMHRIQKLKMKRKIWLKS